jgi:type III secretory pathway component EscV
MESLKQLQKELDKLIKEIEERAAFPIHQEMSEALKRLKQNQISVDDFNIVSKKMGLHSDHDKKILKAITRIKGQIKRLTSLDQ